jgi:hypothetical protein
MSPYMSVLLASKALSSLPGPVIVLTVKNLCLKYNTILNCVVRIFFLVELYNHGKGSFLPKTVF